MKLLTILEFVNNNIPDYCNQIGLTNDLLNKFNTDYFNDFTDYQKYVELNNLPTNNTSFYRLLRAWLGSSTTLLHYNDEHIWIKPINWLLKFNHTNQKVIYKGYRFYKNVNDMNLNEYFEIGNSIVFDKNVALFDKTDKRNISYNSGTSSFDVAKRFAKGWGDTTFEGNDTNIIISIYNPTGILGFRIGNMHEYKEEETIFGYGSNYKVKNISYQGIFKNDVLIELIQS